MACPPREAATRPVQHSPHKQAPGLLGITSEVPWPARSPNQLRRVRCLQSVVRQLQALCFSRQCCGARATSLCVRLQLVVCLKAEVY